MCHFDASITDDKHYNIDNQQTCQNAQWALSEVARRLLVLLVNANAQILPIMFKNYGKRRDLLHL